MARPHSPLILYAGVLGALFLLGLAGGVFYWHPNVIPTLPQAIALYADPMCHPVGDTGCMAGDKGLTITLRLQGRLRPLTAFAVEVDLAGPDMATVNKVAINFAMQGMEMGITRFDLDRQADGLWRGQAILPICTTGRQDWRATVVVSGDPPYSGSFPFILATAENNSPATGWLTPAGAADG